MSLLIELIAVERMAEDYVDWDPVQGILFAHNISILACERFRLKQQRWPGLGDNVEAIMREILSTNTLPEVFQQSINEVYVHHGRADDRVRGGFGTLPTTAALVGGVVAQEVIKLVTNQYTPLDNTVIIDLVKSATEKYKF